MHRRLLTIAAAAGMVLAPDANGLAQARDTTSGFVIDDATVIRKCAGCHARDSTGRLGRLSYLRKTPEGWETSIRRMVTLNNVKLEPAEARSIVRYLSNHQGLAPTEVRPARFEIERRLIDFRYTADPGTERTCRACHSVGRMMLQRRTRSEWELLMAMHRGYYPLVDNQAFRRGPAPPDSGPQPHPMDQAVAHLSRVYPLRTAEWSAWSATMRPPPLEGSWLLSGSEPGRGAFYGRVTITKVPGTDDEFTTRASYRYAAGGAALSREGRSIVYTGHQWRGRSAPVGTPEDSAWREVASVEPGWQEMTGRWFRGGYDEFGMDVTLRRLGPGPVLSGVAPRAIRTGARDVEITVFGAALPRVTAGGSLDLGPGVRVSRVIRSTPEELVVRADVDSAARSGARDVFLAGASLREGAVIYPKVDRLRVTPLANMARVGGIRFPKQFAQFDALGTWNGPDGRPETADDVDLGRVDVTWSIEEYGVTYQDDDVAWIGTLDQNGKFTPALDGPNPERKGNRNNIGDVWVVATQQGAPPNERPLRARAHLVVTVPLYMRWEPWRTAP